MVSVKRLIRWFQIGRGITALIGGGGKTSLLYLLADELRNKGSVVVSTTTHIRRPEHLPFSEFLNTQQPFGSCCTVASMGIGGKLTAPKQAFSELSTLCDYVLVEADGSRQLPLKAHASHEPVIPNDAQAVIAVIGVDGIFRSIREAAHRPQRYAEILQVDPTALVTPRMAMDVVMTYPQVTGILINKADTDAELKIARKLAALSPVPCAICALQSKEPIKELWRNGLCCYS